MPKIETIAPYLSGVGFTLISIDENETGADDIAGQLLLYGGEVINSIIADVDLPPLPEGLVGMVAGKVSNTARGILMAAGTTLTILQGQVMASKPKLSTALRYISQGIQALLAGRPIPSPAI
jgi:hypothetical protein